MPGTTLAPIALLAALAAPLAAQVAARIGAQAAAESAGPKNIIVFISDGGGYNTHRAYELWRGAPMVYQGDGWDRYSAATHALRGSVRPTGPDPLIQDPKLAYDPAMAWDTTAMEGESGGYPFYFAAYRWLRATAPDSANTASAIFTGVTTYKGAINTDGEGNPTRSAAEAASERGMSVGVVSSVPFSHATPACAGGAHVPKREMFEEIAHQMLTDGVCDVIAGGGHPKYDDNGVKRTEASYVFVGQEDWAELAGGTFAHPDGGAWTLVEDAERVRSLAEGGVPVPLMIVPRTGQTLQQQRSPRDEARTTPPGAHEPIAGMPTLREMALAALNGVDDDPDGFFLMVEGGAVDWAMHDNQLGRVIEEMEDYHSAIEAVCEILDAGDRGYDWSNTLVIVTSDHDHLLLGPESDTDPFQPLKDNGPGKLPGYKWHSDSHSNTPVPLFVRGAGVERFAKIPTEPDAFIGGGRSFERPAYFHQAEIGKVMLGLLDGQAGAGAGDARQGEALLR
jgi:alkaline phosphatase